MKSKIFLLLLVAVIFTSKSYAFIYLSSNHPVVEINDCYSNQKVNTTIQLTTWGGEYNNSDKKKFTCIVTPPSIDNPPTPTITPSCFWCGGIDDYDNYGNQIVFGSGHNITINVELTMPNFDILKQDQISYKLLFTPQGSYEGSIETTVTFKYSATLKDPPNSLGEYSYFGIMHINGSPYYHNEPIQLGTQNSAIGKIMGEDDLGLPASVNTAWNWELILPHSEGNYICNTGTTQGEFSSTWNFNMPASIPDKNWIRTPNGKAVGSVHVYVEQDGYFQEAYRAVEVELAPNKPLISGNISETNVAEIYYNTFSASKYDIRYKQSTNSNWEYRTNLTSPISQIVLPQGGAEYIIQARAHNDYGVGYWSKEYQIHTLHTTPINKIRSNIGLTNNWDVKNGDGADRAFKFKLINRAKITATTDYNETDFDTKLEIFNDNKSSTGFYNDDNSTITQYASTINCTLDAGIYYLVVDGYNGDEGQFKVTLNIDETIYTVPFNLESSNLGEANSFDVNGSDGADNAFRIHLPSDSYLNISTCSYFTDYDSKIEVFNLDGTTTGLYNDDSENGCSDNYYASTIEGGFLSSGDYYIVVDGYSGDEGVFSLNVSHAIVSKSTSLSSSNSNYKFLSNTDDLGKYDTDKEESALEDISIYPNPANNVLNVNNSSNFEFTYKLFDASGRLIKSDYTRNSSHIINTENIQEGVYFLNIIGIDKIRVEKISVKH